MTRLRLLGAGIRASHSGRGSLIALALSLSSSALVLSALVLAMIAVSYQVRSEHDAARRLVADQSLIDQGQAGLGRAALQASVMGDYAPNGLQFDVVLLGPHEPDLAPPAGLDRWPSPGEAFLSPALAQQLGESARERYGKVAGIIAIEGLTARNELLVYAAPTPGSTEADRFMPYRGFGDGLVQPWWTTEPLASFGQTTFINPAPLFVLMAVLLALVPSIVLLLVARGLIERTQAHWSIVLRTLGGTPADERWMQCGGLLVPVSAATLTGAAAAGWVSLREVQVPLVDYTLEPTWFRMHWHWLAGVILLGAVSALLILLGRRPGTTRDSTRPQARAHAGRPWTPALAPVFFLLALNLPDRLDPLRGSRWQLVYVLLAAAAICALPWLVSFLLLRLYSFSETSARTHGWGSLLFAARTALTSRRNMTRAVSALAVGAGLLLQVLFIANAVGPRARLADTIAGAGSGRILVADFNAGLSRAQVEAILQGLRPGTHMLRVNRTDDVDTGGVHVTIQSDCAGLLLVGLPCRSGRVTAEAMQLTPLGMRAAVDLTDAVIRVAPAQSGSPSVEPATLILTAEADGWQEAAASAVMTSSWPKNGVSAPAHGYAAAALADATQSRWLGFFAVFALSVTGLAVTLAVVNQFLEQADRGIAVMAFAPSRRPLAAAVCLGLFAPLAVGGVCGVLLAQTLTTAPVAAGVARPFGGSIGAAMSTSIVAIAAAASAVAFLAVRRASTTWRPGAAE